MLFMGKERQRMNQYFHHFHWGHQNQRMRRVVFCLLVGTAAFLIAPFLTETGTARGADLCNNGGSGNNYYFWSNTSNPVTAQIDWTNWAFGATYSTIYWDAAPGYTITEAGGRIGANSAGQTKTVHINSGAKISGANGLVNWNCWSSETNGADVDNIVAMYVTVHAGTLRWSPRANKTPGYQGGTITVNGGAALEETTTFGNKHALGITNNGTYTITNSSSGSNDGGLYIFGSTGGSLGGSGTVNINGHVSLASGQTHVTVNMGSGSVINVNSGAHFCLGSWGMTDYKHWNDNKSDLNVHGTFNLWDTNCQVYVDALGGGGSIVQNNGSSSTLVIGVDNGGGQFSGSIANGISLIKKGSGIQYLSGANNSYTGGTRIEGGCLGAVSNNAFGTGAITLNNGTIFNYNGSAPVISNNVVLEGTGSVRVGWSNCSITLNGVISGSGQLQVANDGTNYLVLGNSNNSFTGGLQVGGGVNKHSDTGAAYARLGANNALGSGVLSFVGTADTGVLEFDTNGFSESSIAGLAATASIRAKTTLRNSSATKSSLTLNVINSNQTFCGLITGNIEIIKTGNQIQYLDNANSYTGGTIIRGGALGGSANTSFGSGLIVLEGGSLHNLAANITVANTIQVAAIGGALRGYGSTTFTVSGQITNKPSEAGKLIIDADSGVIVLSNANNTYSGGTVIGQQLTQTHTAGYLKLGAETNALSSGPVSFAQGGDSYLDMNGFSENGVAGLNSTFTASYVKNSSATASSLTLDGAGTYSFAGAIQNGINLTKSGSGTQTLTGANTYSGNTVVNAGKLLVSGSGVLGAGSIFVHGGELEWNSSATYTIPTARMHIGSQNGSTGTFRLTSGALTPGATHYDIYIGGYDNTFNSTAVGLFYQTGGSLTTNWFNIGEYGTGTYNLSGGSANFGNLCIGRRGDGTMNYTGGSVTLRSTAPNATETFILGGNFGVATTGTLNQSAGNITTACLTYGKTDGSRGYYNLSGGTLTLTGTVQTVGGATAREMNISGTGQMVIQGLNTLSGLTRLSLGGSGSGTGAILFKSAATLSDSAELTANTSVGVDSGVTGAMQGPISGEFSLTKLGAGTLLLSGASTYTGATTISAGTLKMGTTNAISASTGVNISSGTLDLGGFNQTLSGLSSSNMAAVIANSSGTNTLTLDLADGVSQTYSGTIQNAVALTKTGAGTLFLSRTASLNGAVNAVSVQGGTLVLTQADPEADTGWTNGFFGTTPITIGTDGTLRCTARWMLNATASNQLTVNGTLTLDNYQYLTSMTLHGGTVNGNDIGYLWVGGDYGPATWTVTGGTNTISKTIQFVASKSLTLDVQGGVLTLGAVQTHDGTSSLVKTGSGTLIFSAPTDYYGTTTISAGTVQMAVENGLVSTSEIVVTGQWNLNGYNQTIQGLSGTGTIQSSTDATLYAGFGGMDSTFDGTMAQAISLTKVGDGVLTLTGVHTYTGLTTVEAGTLKLGESNRLPTSSETGLLMTGGTFDLASYDQTLTNLSGTTGIITNTSDEYASTLTINTETSVTFGGQILNDVGVVNLVKEGSGTLTLTGDNAYGTTTINGGRVVFTGTNNIGQILATGTTLQFGDETETGTATGDVELTDSTVEFHFTVAKTIQDTIISAEGTTNILFNDKPNPVTLAGVLNGAGEVRKMGTGTIVLTNAASTFVGLTRVMAGTLQIGDDSTTGTPVSANTRITIDPAGTLDFHVSGSTATTLTTEISGSGKLVKSGSNTLTITNNGAVNSFGGEIEVRGGRLILQTAVNNVLVNGCTVQVDTGSMVQDVTVMLGNAEVTGGTINGTLTIDSDKAASVISSGTVANLRMTRGLTQMVDGQVTSALLDGGVFDLVANATGVEDLELLKGTIRIALAGDVTPNETVAAALSGGLQLTGDDVSLHLDIQDVFPETGDYFLFTTVDPLAMPDNMFKSVTVQTTHGKYTLEGADVNKAITFDTANNRVILSFDRSQVPEPATWFLMLLGSMGLLFYRKAVRRPA